jgi:hypothetical protein
VVVVRGGRVISAEVSYGRGVGMERLTGGGACCTEFRAAVADDPTAGPLRLFAVLPGGAVVELVPLGR